MGSEMCIRDRHPSAPFSLAWLSPTTRCCDPAPQLCVLLCILGASTTKLILAPILLKAYASVRLPASRLVAWQRRAEAGELQARLAGSPSGEISRMDCPRHSRRARQPRWTARRHITLSLNPIYPDRKTPPPRLSTSQHGRCVASSSSTSSSSQPFSCRLSTFLLRSRELPWLRGLSPSPRAPVRRFLSPLPRFCYAPRWTRFGCCRHRKVPSTGAPLTWLSE